MANLLGTRISHFRVIDLLGKGGMGEVYVGYDETLDRKVALKSLRSDLHPDAESKLRFLREARVLSQLAHPNICQIHDYIEGGEADVLVLELIDGQSLAKAMRKGLDYPQKLHIAEQIAGALMAAHEKGIIHRDLKPDNVMLTDGNQVKVLDFGLSRLQGDAITTLLPPPRAKEPPLAVPPGPDVEETRVVAESTPRPASGSSAASTGSLTTLGTIMGTLGYMSPEQARGEVASAACDLYSLGLLLQELFTGNPTYERGLDAATLLLKAQEGVTLPVEGIDADLAALIRRLKSPAPTARPSAMDTAERLAWIRLKPLRRRKKILVAAAMVVLALFSVAMTVQTIRALRAERIAQQEAQTSKQVSEFLVRLFKVADPSEARGNTVTAREILDKGAEKIERELKDQPQIQGRLMGTMGMVYWKLGLYHQAQPLLENALAIREKALGPDHPDVASSLSDLAVLYWEQNKYAEAEPLFQRSLRIREKALGPDHLDVAASLNNLANLYADQGRFVEAQQLLQRSLGIRERALGPDHLDVAASLNNLAALYEEHGKYAEAEPLYQRSLRIKERALGPDHLNVAISLNNLANLYADQGKYAEAEPLYQRSLKIREKALGPDHPDMADGLNNLAVLYKHQGRFAEAEPLYLRSLQIWEKAVGPDHAGVADCLNNLAVLCKDQGKYAEAEPLFQRSLKIKEKILGPNHPSVAESLYNLGALRARQGRQAEALALLRRALPSGGDMPWMGSIGKEPDLASLHGDPEFERIVAEVKRRAEASPSAGP